MNFYEYKHKILENPSLENVINKLHDFIDDEVICCHNLLVKYEKKPGVAREGISQNLVTDIQEQRRRLINLRNNLDKLI